MWSLLTGGQPENYHTNPPSNLAQVRKAITELLKRLNGGSSFIYKVKDESRCAASAKPQGWPQQVDFKKPARMCKVDCVSMWAAMPEMYRAVGMRLGPHEADSQVAELEEGVGEEVEDGAIIGGDGAVGDGADMPMAGEVAEGGIATFCTC